VTKIILVTTMNLATPKDGAKNEILFHKPVSGSSLVCKYKTEGEVIVIYYGTYYYNCDKFYNIDT
jgi:hypothetical protein